MRVFRAVDQNLQFCGLPPLASLLPPETFTFSSRKPVVLNKSSLYSNMYGNVLAKLSVLIMEPGGAWGSGDAPQGRTGTWSASRTTVMRHCGGTVWGQEGKGVPSTSSACATKPGETSGLYRFERKNFSFA